MSSFNFAAAAAFSGALICAWIASKKGRTVIGWALIGLIFPIVGIGVALAVPDKGRNSQ